MAKKRTKTDRLLGSLRSRQEKRTPIATEMFLPNNSGDHIKSIKTNTPIDDEDLANKKYVDDKFPVTHASTTGQTTDDHHNESHNVASHSDTSATGAELNTLTDNSMADTLHRHSELSANDGDPDQALVVGATGTVGIGTAAPQKPLHLKGNNELLKFQSNSVSVNTYASIGFSTTTTDTSPSKSEIRVYRRAGGYEDHDMAFIVGNNLNVLYLDNNTNVGIGTAPAAACKLDINGDSVRVRTAQSPASNGTGTQGEIAWDSNYIYVCTATNTWKRAALTGGY